jgi:FtsH-binding integral membrane protein
MPMATQIDPALKAPIVQQTSFEEATYRKVTLRLVPILLLCYVVAYLDRVSPMRYMASAPAFSLSGTSSSKYRAT